VDDERRRPRPLANTEIIDEAAHGSQPDVEVFRLNDDLEVQPPKRQRGKWIEDARTMLWEGGKEPAPAVQIDPQPQSHSGQRWVEDVPYEEVGSAQHRAPLQIEAPIRVRVKNVARISPDRRLWLMTRPDSMAAEQFRVLALKLREERGARVVAVASPTRNGEGYLAAANLALAFSEGGRSRTVLVDANLRGSEISDLFELNEGPSLSDQIRQHRSHPDQDWVTLGFSANLHFLPAGAAEKNPASLLSSEVMADLMLELRRYFDFIVVATPPVMDSADVNILQEHVDGVLMVVRSSITRRDSLSASIRRLGQGRFLGVVMVDAKR